MFLDGVPAQLESVATALEQNDYDSARRRVHAMKPHLKFMGMKVAAGFAESIEQLCADQRDPARVHSEFAEVRQQCELAFKELRAKL
jgi:HPt (histidine-containing phosphotransfer) domain-containing protein